uniref:Uncharacterized protein n=1 Tax=Grammatophora oceanica TaxID=210454 RepID=A0A7S1VN27_9STRA|mmetsp:Transcript_49227/g.73394  ORF Transcript_49227/g.73394 Transcript_49227/m.73394 type:complete len:210 (+) Transcript_49227:72-701(+)|eukprot:CAMPEP_0194045316 /NCGR_PEP_ID=MMETSP0009_2-20130614/16681_1 /TAXON_ID=210454 /ORGANISM="Grammatophora oceanica, Strain CCMP 410" /LENGTH=209 /DNA_ID=CAMNT_0038690143 /DNA_START=24 /DNA_END=653 /DNA_ORIENTATION=-
MKTFAVVFASVVASVTGFAPKHSFTTTGLLLRSSETAVAHQPRSLLHLADQPHDNDLDSNRGSKKGGFDLYDVTMGSPLVPTFLVMAPFVSNPKIRDHVPFFTVPLIATMALAWNVYEQRKQEISYAYEKRVGALVILKHRMQGQLQAKSTEEDVTIARAAYQEALEEELELRFFSGRAIVPPPKEMIEGAQLYLGCDISDKGELVAIN